MVGGLSECVRAEAGHTADAWPVGGPWDRGGSWCQVPVALEPWEASTEAATRASCCPQDLEKPTAIAYRMKGGGQPGGGGSSSTEDTPKRPPEPKPSQCLPRVGSRVGQGWVRWFSRLPPVLTWRRPWAGWRGGKGAGGRKFPFPSPPTPWDLRPLPGSLKSQAWTPPHWLCSKLSSTNRPCCWCV